MKTQTIMKQARAKGWTDAALCELVLRSGVPCTKETIRQARVKGREMAFNKVWPIYTKVIRDGVFPPAASLVMRPLP